MTAFGEDRPGIVADVTRILYENGCNLEENSMTLLADEFTLILLFSCSSEGIEEELQRECRRLEREKGISAFLRPLDTMKGGQSDARPVDRVRPVVPTRSPVTRLPRHALLPVLS